MTTLPKFNPLEFLAHLNIWAYVFAYREKFSAIFLKIHYFISQNINQGSNFFPFSDSGKRLQKQGFEYIFTSAWVKWSKTEYEIWSICRLQKVYTKQILRNFVCWFICFYSFNELLRGIFMRFFTNVWYIFIRPTNNFPSNEILYCYWICLFLKSSILIK